MKLPRRKSYGKVEGSENSQPGNLAQMRVQGGFAEEETLGLSSEGW